MLQSIICAFRSIAGVSLVPRPIKEKNEEKSAEGSGAWAGVHQELRNATGGAEST